VTVPAEQLVIPDGLPEAVLEAVADGVVVSFEQKNRGTRIFLLQCKKGWPFRLLKVAEGSDPFSVLAEIDRLDWLDRRLPVPKVLASEPLPLGGHATVLALPAGAVATARETVHGPPEVVELFAKALRFVHEVPIDRCPFSNRLDIRLRSIQRKLRAGRYDGMQLSEAYRRYPPTRLFEILNESRPTEEDLVFAHGAWHLRSVFLDAAGVSGIVDWDRAGVSDRYADLAMGAKVIADDISVELVPLFFEAYGVPRPDPLRLDYYQLLAEFW
jgi:aminoglycoside 3'-phosphotransferase-2